MTNIVFKLLTIVLLFILLSTNVCAMSLGSIVKNSFVEVTNTESAKITMLFWNIENETYNVKLSIKDAPKDWIVIIDPTEFILNKSTGEEYIVLPYLNESIKAKVVNVFVKPIENCKLGNYSVFIKAETELAQNEINGMNIISERLFKFEINVKGFEETNYDSVEKTGISGKYVDVKENKQVINNDYNIIDKNFLYFFVVLIIILISMIIYKKYNG